MWRLRQAMPNCSTAGPSLRPPTLHLPWACWPCWANPFPGPLRIFLLALAIIDDIVAVLIIAFFYSGGLDYSGFGIAFVGLLLVLLFNRMGVASAWLYVLPGAVLWLGLLQTGAHPTLAGVVLGLMTPVAMRPRTAPPSGSGTDSPVARAGACPQRRF